MKSWQVFTSAVLLVGFFSATTSSLAIPDLRVSQQSTTQVIEVGVFDASGNLVKTLAMGTIREKVSTSGQEFVASFGQNPAGNVVLIASPDPDDPKEVTLRINGRRIVISRDAVITIVFPKDPETGRLGDPLIRPGLVGTVSVDGRRLAPDVMVSLDTTQPVSIAQANPPPVNPITNPNSGLDGSGLDAGDFSPNLDLTSFPPAGSPGFPAFGLSAPLSGLGPPDTLARVPSSFSGFLNEVGGFLGEIRINLNPAAATPTVPEQT